MGVHQYRAQPGNVYGLARQSSHTGVSHVRAEPGQDLRDAQWLDNIIHTANGETAQNLLGLGQAGHEHHRNV